MWIEEKQKKPRLLEIVSIIFEYFSPERSGDARTYGFGYWTDDRGWLGTNGKPMKDMGSTVMYWLERPPIDMPGWKETGEDSIATVYIKVKDD